MVGGYPLAIAYGVPVAAVIAVWTQHMLTLGVICALAVGAIAVTILLAIRQTRRLATEQARRAAAETSALQAQRMELLGQIAAGVAHDFANVIQVVDSMGRLIAGSDDKDRMRSFANTVIHAADRGRALTRNMLDFARHDSVAGDMPTATNPAEAVQEVCDLLARSLGHAHRLRCDVQVEGLPKLVRGDRAGLEVAVMNLVANSRDAMPGGGEIVVRIVPCLVAGPHPAGLVPGSYAHVSVTDAGSGMAPEVLARAGEAFFTTKPRGKGTGLGLAGARGFDERAGGALRVESEQGTGTTVGIWLPSLETQPEPTASGSNVSVLRPAS
jgi:two-component system NtrC family sensor kinase